MAENGFSGVVHQSGTLTLDRVRSQNHPLTGLAVSPLLGVRALVRDSQFSGNGNGISVSSEAGETADVTVERSAAFLNTTGFLVQTSGTGIANLVVRDSVANENVSGIRASGSTGVPTVFVAGSTVTQNTTGFEQTGTTAVFNSLGNNVRRGNGTDASGVITTLALQ